MTQIHFQVTFSLPLPSGGYFVPINVTVHGKTYLNAYPLDKQKR